MKHQWIILIICFSLLGLTPVSSALGVSNYNLKLNDIDIAQGDSFSFLADRVNPAAIPVDHIWVLPNPTPDEITCKNLQLTIGSTNEEQISYVKFIYYGPDTDGPVEIGTDYSPPYQMDINTCDLVPGWYQIYAIAYDNNDKIIFSIKIPLFIPFINYMPLLMHSG